MESTGNQKKNMAESELELDVQKDQPSSAPQLRSKNQFGNALWINGEAILLLALWKNS